MESTKIQQTQDISTEKLQEEVKTDIAASKTYPITYREYFEDSYRFTAKAKILDCVKLPGDKNEVAVILERTIFHPQGGGQPADTGIITDGKNTLTVSSLVAKDDVIQHIGIFTEGSSEFQEGQEVDLQVDKDKRLIYAKYHSAGHLLDIATRRVGLSHLQPSKGYHFPVGAYVDYIGAIDMTKKDDICKQITTAANAIIQEKQALEQLSKTSLVDGAAEVKKEEDPAVLVWSQVFPYDEAGKILPGGVPPYIPKGADLRVVKLTPEDEGCPCGGTHVKRVTDIVGIEVTKVVKKGKSVRFSYVLKETA